jgi:hypothetical protein
MTPELMPELDSERGGMRGIISECARCAGLVQDAAIGVVEIGSMEGGAVLRRS